MNYKIRRYKNYGIIEPVPEGRLATTLQRLMSYKKQGAEFMPNPMWAIVRLYNIKKGTFPWGFRDLVEKIFRQWNTESDDNFFFSFERRFPPQILAHKELRDYQIKAVNSLLLNNGGVLSMPTGSGKTKTVIEYLRIMNKRSLVIVTTLDIKRQWEEQTFMDKNITILNWQNKRVDLEVSHSDIIVYDECHHVSAKKIYKTAMGCNTEAIIVGVSATVAREDGEDMRLTAALGDIVYKISRRELIEQGYLCDAEVRYVNVDYVVNPYLTYQDEYKRYIVENWPRNMKIIQLASIEALKEKKVLILVTQIGHGRVIFEELIKKFKVLFLNGGVKDREFKLEDYDIIIGSNIFDEGVDLPALDVLILAGSGKSENRLTQRIGRVLRPSMAKDKAVIYDFCDQGKYLGSHYRKRRKSLENEFPVVDYDPE